MSPEGEVGDHCVLEFALAEKQLRLRVAPWEWRFSRWSEAMFGDFYLERFAHNAGEPDDLRMPWSIVGFHSWRQEDGRCRLSLHCRHIRWNWTSAWPMISRGPS
ncbi:MAG TPA: hypothetical protein VG406_00110 [Isosphaeraceae bacterium]|nr:hypothetical protein [Isosphaeraceae bacterium]